MNIFEELMAGQSTLTEGVNRKSRKKTTKVESKKIPLNKLKVESMKILEDYEDYDELDDQFAKDPEEVEDGEVVLVIDPEANPNEEVPEDAAEDMVGDSVYKCPICGANYVCDCDAAKTEGIEVDENNVPTECPVCGDDAEQILIGEIAPAEGAGEEAPVDPVESEDTFEDEEEEDIIEDSVKRRGARRVNESVSVGDVYEMKLSDDADPRLGISNSLHGTFKVARVEGNWAYCKPQDEAAKDWVIYLTTMDEDEIDPETLQYYDSEGLVGFEDWYLEDEFNKLNESKKLKRRVKENKTRRKRVKEDLDNVCPECGEEDCICDGDALELADPVTEESAEPAVAVNADNVYIDFDEKKLESIMNSFLRENYKGALSFKVTKGTYRNGTLKLEYVVRSGRKPMKKGVLAFEGYNMTKRARRVVSLKGKDRGAFTESFTRKPAFILECVCVRNKIVPTSLKYNFTKRVNESLYRVSGQANFYLSNSQKQVSKKQVAESKRHRQVNESLESDAQEIINHYEKYGERSGSHDQYGLAYAIDSFLERVNNYAENSGESYDEIVNTPTGHLDTMWLSDYGLNYHEQEIIEDYMEMKYKSLYRVESVSSISKKRIVEGATFYNKSMEDSIRRSMPYSHLTDLFHEPAIQGGMVILDQIWNIYEKPMSQGSFNDLKKGLQKIIDNPKVLKDPDNFYTAQKIYDVVKDMDNAEDLGVG